MKRIVLTFGFIAGGILSVMMLLTLPFMHKIGLERAMVIGYTSMVLGFLMVYFGVRAYRDTVGNGRVGFGRAFAVGILITLLGSACYVATWEVIYNTMMPNFADDYAATVLKEARASGASEQQIAAKTRELAEFKEMYANPVMNVAMTFLEPLPVGLLLTLVSAGVLSRKRRYTPDAEPAPVHAGAA
jgi:hypothetical protein